MKFKLKESSFKEGKLLLKSIVIVDQFRDAKLNGDLIRYIALNSRIELGEGDLIARTHSAAVTPQGLELGNLYLYEKNTHRFKKILTNACLDDVEAVYLDVPTHEDMFSLMTERSEVKHLIHTLSLTPSLVD